MKKIIFTIMFLMMIGSVFALPPALINGEAKIVSPHRQLENTAPTPSTTTGTLSIVNFGGDEFQCSRDPSVTLYEKSNSKGVISYTNNRNKPSIVQFHEGGTFGIVGTSARCSTSGLGVLSNWDVPAIPGATVSNLDDCLNTKLFPDKEYMVDIYYCEKTGGLCTDTDGGIDAFKFGETYIFKSNSFEDKCGNDGYAIYEKYCGSVFGLPAVKTAVIDCRTLGAQKCQEGVCITCDAGYLGGSTFCDDNNVQIKYQNKDCSVDTVLKQQCGSKICKNAACITPEPEEKIRCPGDGNILIDPSQYTVERCAPSPKEFCNNEGVYLPVEEITDELCEIKQFTKGCEAEGGKQIPIEDYSEDRCSLDPKGEGTGVVIEETKAPEVRATESGTIEAKFFFKNTGEGDMQEDWILEIQTLFQGAFSVISQEEQTCNPSKPGNVHKNYRLNAGEEATITLEAPIGDKGIYSVIAFTVDRCCVKTDGTPSEEPCSFGTPTPYRKGETIKSGLNVETTQESECGDALGICDGSENFDNCPTDCDSWIGDGFCDRDKEDATNSGDCQKKISILDKLQSFGSLNFKTILLIGGAGFIAFSFLRKPKGSR